MPENDHENDRDRLMDVREAAATLGVSPRTVVSMAAAGYLERIKIFGATRYRASQVDRCVRYGTTAEVTQEVLNDR